MKRIQRLTVRVNVNTQKNFKNYTRNECETWKKTLETSGELEQMSVLLISQLLYLLLLTFSICTSFPLVSSVVLHLPHSFREYFSNEKSGHVQSLCTDLYFNTIYQSNSARLVTVQYDCKFPSLVLVQYDCKFPYSFVLVQYDCKFPLDPLKRRCRAVHTYTIYTYIPKFL